MSLTGVIFLLFFLVGLGVALVRRPIYGLYVYVAVFYLDPINRWWGASLPDLRWSFSAAAVTLIGWALHSSPRKVRFFSHAPIWLFFVYVLWMVVRIPWAIDPTENWFQLNIYAKYLLVIYLVYVIVDTRTHLAGFLFVHAMGCLYLGVQAWMTGGGGGRLDGIGGPGINDANSMAMQLSTGVFAAAAYYFAEKRWRRFIVTPVALFALNGLVLSGSRGGFIATLVGGLAFYLFRPKGQFRVVLPYAVLACVLLGYVASASFIERMGTLAKPVAEQAENDLSVETRLVLLGAQWRMALDHPFGVGNGGTEALSRSYLEKIYLSGDQGRSSHNSIMSSLVDQGFFGVFVWMAIMWTLWSQLRTNKRWCDRNDQLVAGWLNAGLASMFAVVVIAGLFSPQQRTEVYIWILAMTCAFAQVMRAAESDPHGRTTIQRDRGIGHPRKDELSPLEP